MSFQTNGKWLAISEQNNNLNIPNSAKGYISPKGDPNFPSNDNMPCPRFPLGSLVIVGSNNQCKSSGAQGYFELESKETVYFLMNDVFGLYEDNEGHIETELKY